MSPPRESRLTGVSLPGALEPHRAALADAFQAPVHGEWPEDTRFISAEQPAAIANVIITPLHSHLGPARIAWLFREKMSRRDKALLAKVGKASPLVAFFADYEFVVQVNWQAWRDLAVEQRIALVDHELCHIGVTDRGFVMLSHDVEEFGSIVARWGLWEPDLAAFGRIVADQGELFTGPRPVD